MAGIDTLVDREQDARRLHDAFVTVSRWWARDFKRGDATRVLTQTQYAILSLLAEQDGSTTSRLAQHLDLTVPTVVRAVDALDRKGFVVRRRGSQDGREVLIRATERGARVHAAFERVRLDRVIDLLSAMPYDDVRGLVHGYESLARAAADAVQREREAV